MDNPQLVVDLMQNAALIIFGIIILRMNRRPRQTQTGGAGATQIQSGGTITIDETALGRAERFARQQGGQL